MERVSKSKPLPRHLPGPSKFSSTHSSLIREDASRYLTRDSPDFDSLAPVGTWKGKNSVQEQDELMQDVLTFNGSGDSLEESGSFTAFSGASHPPEPVDSDLMRLVCVPIGQNKSESKILKGPFLEDLSIRVPGIKPSISVEEANESPQNTENSDEKECVWDASQPPSGNVSPLSSIDSTGIIRAMSIVNSTPSTYQSDCMLSFDQNFDSRKESAKTSMSRASDSSGLSDDSNWSNFTGSASKPHKGNDPRWKAILGVRARDGILGMSHFRLLKRVGFGDIGSVYLSELSGTRCYFAMKVMDKASLASRKKLTRAQTEREILQLLDHPFLPTLYTNFETDRFSCLVMEYCPGGDLHTLRQRQPGKHFSEYAARYIFSSKEYFDSSIMI